MKLVSTTLTGEAAAVIGDALASVVGVVDTCLVVDTRASDADATLEVARRVAGDKLVVRRFAWCEDFAAARNFALDAAAEAGGDWAITVDTDERIEWRGEDLRATLATSAERTTGRVQCWMMLDEWGTYAKERVFRLPAGARFEGPTHEAFPAYAVGAAVLPRARFRELPKTAAQVRAKFERDARVLERWSSEHPDEARWFYYLGDALHGLGRHEDAIAAFRRCASMRGWNEESAWACYRAAECACALGRWDDAVESCALGLARHAGIGELAWLAGFASWKKGDLDQAIWWSRVAAGMSAHTGWGGRVPRVGFRHLPGLYEGPWDVLRWALRARGDEAAAKEAERLYEEAKAAREKPR